MLSFVFNSLIRIRNDYLQSKDRIRISVKEYRYPGSGTLTDRRGKNRKLMFNSGYRVDGGGEAADYLLHKKRKMIQLLSAYRPYLRPYPSPLGLFVLKVSGFMAY